MNQENAILEYLKQGHFITPLEALHKFGCFRLGARISDLKKKGYSISSKLVKIDGKHVGMYWMER